MFKDASKLLEADGLSDEQARELLQSVGFADWATARERLRGLCPDEPCRRILAGCLDMLLAALAETAVPDGSLVNFERFVQSVSDRAAVFRFLADNPRAVEILIKLFAGSQFLTEILIGNPQYLEDLTRHKRLADFKSREEFAEGARSAASTGSFGQRMDALRRFQQQELLRIGACDTFGLLDFKSVTVQLSLLADALVQTCLQLLSAEMGVRTDEFCVLAFGKLGGEELNYSSDIDLVFLASGEATAFWALGQRLIQALSDATAEGFLYRVDMRLRPWGRSGPLVVSTSSYLDYVRSHALPWERQAMLKARPIAGRLDVGYAFLEQAQPYIFEMPVEVVRESIRDMKQRIEAGLRRKGRQWGEVKSGAGSIRDIEFVTQFLQLAHGGEHPEIRSANTLDALVRLADLGLLPADEFRQLTTAYVFLRTIEHALQLMHNKQVHALPEDPRELAYLARRLDFPDGETFVAHYNRHVEEVRAIYDRYLAESPRGAQPAESESAPTARSDALLAQMEPSYSQVFTPEDIDRHAALLEQVTPEDLVRVEARPASDELWEVTVAGYDQLGDLSAMCGLLFVYGFNIVAGNVFTALRGDGRLASGRAGLKRQEARRFVNVFIVRPPLGEVLPEVWTRYERDLRELMRLLAQGRRREAHGALAKRVANALRDVPKVDSVLYPIEIRIDNQSSDRYTILDIRGRDTIGFLYELTNALALFGVDISRVTIRSAAERVHDTLFVTDADGGKITDPERQRALRSAVVLVKHFTHLLPRSPNPEAALLHFRDFLEQLFQEPRWPDKLASLERSEVLDALARLLGVSDFLWEDFLRLQHSNLFPVVTDLDALARRKDKGTLAAELARELATAEDEQARRACLNAFKDREMFRTDMRHILGLIASFEEFSDELTDVVDVVVQATTRLCESELQARYGAPRLEDGRPCRLCVAALGKCGGRELGFASDIELMFIYEGPGRTTGVPSDAEETSPDETATITNTEYYLKLVERFTQAIWARREGIFQIDLRLRPYGRAGSLAVSLDAFRSYFAPEGAAWPYERQALVKLRPVAGDADFGELVVRTRDELVYTGEPFDVAAMRAMRDRQLSQLVKAGTVNAKLSPGGLVDIEYFVQGLQITYGADNPALRTTNTLRALEALHAAGLLDDSQYHDLRAAYVFLRRVIDALRMVRGDARDLTVPPAESEEFEFLARRLGYAGHVRRLRDDLERHMARVHELGRLLEELVARRAAERAASRTSSRTPNNNCGAQ